MANYLIIGLGKIGLTVANTLAAAGKQVIAVNRSERTMIHPAITLVQTDARFLAVRDLGVDCQTLTHACIIVSPSEPSVQGYKDSYFAISQNFIQLAQQLPHLQRVVFISSTSVYAQNQGEKIDSHTPVAPPSAATAQVLLDTERLLQQAFLQRCTIIRPSGIYGRERLRLVNMVTKLVNGEIAAPSNTWSNRIFDEDLVSVIVKVLTETSPLPLYLATDYEPAPMFGVLQGIAQLQGVNLNLTDALPTTGKRVISNLPKNWLHYPNWQAGYHAILQTQTAQQGR